MKNSRGKLKKSISILFIGVLTLQLILKYQVQASNQRYLLTLGIILLAPTLLASHTYMMRETDMDYSTVGLLILLSASSTYLVNILNSMAVNRFGIAVYSIVFFYIVSAPLEEGVKLVGIKIGDLISPKDDYVILGGLIGFGYAIGETLFYMSDFQLTLNFVIGRSSAGLLHVCLGIIIGLLIFGRENPFSIRNLIRLIIIVTIHATYNYLIIGSNEVQTLTVSSLYVGILTLIILLFLLKSAQPTD